MIKKWLVLLLLAAVSASLACEGVAATYATGSGKPQTRDFNLSGFTGVQAAAAFAVHIDREDAFKVEVTADDNLWDVLDISVSSGTLHLQTKPGVSLTNSRLSASVTLPSLKLLDLSGGSQADAASFLSGDNLTATLSGGASLTLANDNFGTAVFDISGSAKLAGKSAMTNARFTVSGGGNINLSGSGGGLAIDASGGSQITLDQYQVETASLTMSGGSQARIYSRNITLADLSGGSRLYYVDSPVLGKIQTSGGSSVGKE